jgi:hypothetical protein
MRQCGRTWLSSSLPRISALSFSALSFSFSAAAAAAAAAAAG